MGYMGGTTSGKSTKKSDEQKTLVLLDSHAILHRAFHALPDFSSSKGEPTGALYGLSAMLITIIQKLNPDYVVACLDLPQATHRHDVYDGYKATRKKTDDGLSQQLAQAPRVFEAFHIPTYAAPGFEADDCLGTIVHTLKDREDIRIIIASGDMDTLQLVRGDDVQVFTLRKGLNDTVMYNEQAVIDRFGFKPEHMPDYKGLRGDPSDNIKGIPGIGEKTATTLIQTFGGIKEMYATLKTNRQNMLKIIK
jgi:DNA polymerase-1